MGNDCSLYQVLLNAFLSEEECDKVTCFLALPGVSALRSSNHSLTWTYLSSIWIQHLP